LNAIAASVAFVWWTAASPYILWWAAAYALGKPIFDRWIWWIYGAVWGAFKWAFKWGLNWLKWKQFDWSSIKERLNPNIWSSSTPTPPASTTT
jgi:hypothetical protein